MDDYYLYENKGVVWECIIKGLLCGIFILKSALLNLQKADLSIVESLTFVGVSLNALRRQTIAQVCFLEL